jgi:hypothetical protein
MGATARYKKVLFPTLVSSYFHHHPSIWWSSIFLTSPRIEPVYQSFPSGSIFLLPRLELILPRRERIRSRLERIGPRLEGSRDILPIFPSPATIEISLGSPHTSPHF